MRKTRKILLAGMLVLCLLPVPVLGTGPSYVVSVIAPVSVNEDGFILCKTKCEDNSMGARTLMPIRYGWAVIYPTGRIEEYNYHFLDSETYEDYDLLWSHYQYLEKLFAEEIDWEQPPVSLLPLIERYGFCEHNTVDYLVDKVLPYEDFLRRYGLTPREAPQKTLGGHRSLRYCKTVHIDYEFPNVVLLKNYALYDDSDPVGAFFDFYITYSHIEELLDYEVFEITGVIATK